MAGLFGTRAVVQTDVDLILQVVALALLLVGLVGRKRKVKQHTAIMAAASFLELATFLQFMGPVILNNFGFFMEFTKPLVATLWIHAAAGTVTLILALGLIVSWATRPTNMAFCYKRKHTMLWVSIAWAASVALGVLGYYLAYIA